MEFHPLLTLDQTSRVVVNFSWAKCQRLFIFLRRMNATFRQRHSQPSSEHLPLLSYGSLQNDIISFPLLPGNFPGSAPPDPVLWEGHSHKEDDPRVSHGVGQAQDAAAHDGVAEVKDGHAKRRLSLKLQSQKEERKAKY